MSNQSTQGLRGSEKNDPSMKRKRVTPARERQHAGGHGRVPSPAVWGLESARDLLLEILASRGKFEVMSMKRQQVFYLRIFLCVSRVSARACSEPRLMAFAMVSAHHSMFPSLAFFMRSVFFVLLFLIFPFASGTTLKSLTMPPRHHARDGVDRNATHTRPAPRYFRRTAG